MGLRLSKLKHFKGKRKHEHDERAPPSGISFDYDYTYTQTEPPIDFSPRDMVDAVNIVDSDIDNDDDDNADSVCYEDMDGDSCYISTTDAHVGTQEEGEKNKESDDLYDNLPAQKYTYNKCMQLSNGVTPITKTSAKYVPFNLDSAPYKALNKSAESAYVPPSVYKKKSARTPSFDFEYCDSQSLGKRFSIVKGYSDLKKKPSEHYSDLKKKQSDSNDKTCIIPENFVPSMVEAFRPLIEECIRVSEVLPYLQFIEDREAIIAKERESPKRAASLLLDTIICSDEMGKWTTFLNALRTVGYRYVANILLGETELDLSVHRRLLQIFTPEIINNLEPSELIDHLYAKEVISQTDKEEIECEKRNRGSCAASLMLLDRIPRRIQNWYNEFVSALRACGFDFVADNIDLPELNQSSCCTECSSSDPGTGTKESARTFRDNMSITPGPENSASGHVLRKECSSSDPSTVTKESSTMVTDNMYITPENSASGQFLRREASEQKRSVRFSSQFELIEEKRRLTLELQEIKDKQKLKKDIERLQKLIDIVANAETDEDSANEEDTINITGTHNKQVKNNGTNTVCVEKFDKATQVENEETTAIPVRDQIETDVNLSEVKLKDIWKIVKAHIAQEIKIELNSNATDNQGLRNQSIDIPVQNTYLENNAPMAHMQLRQNSYDSGMYSMYIGAPDNYV